MAFVALWTLLLAPALCLGGAIAHPCISGSGVRNDCAGTPSCQDDPCTLGGPGTVTLDSDSPESRLATVPLPSWVLPRAFRVEVASPGQPEFPPESHSLSAMLLPLLI